MELLNRYRTSPGDELAKHLEWIVAAIRAALAKGTFVGLRRAREHIRSGQIIEWLQALGVDVAPLLGTPSAVKARVVEALQNAGASHTDADEFRTHGARDGLSLVAALALDALAGLGAIPSRDSAREDRSADDARSARETLSKEERGRNVGSCRPSVHEEAK